MKEGKQMTVAIRLAGAPSAERHCDCQPVSQSWFELNSLQRVAPLGLTFLEASAFAMASARQVSRVKGYFQAWL